MANAYVANGHVIGDDYLLGFVQGTLDPAEALLVATQYHITPEAANRVKAFADYATASFEQAEPHVMRCSAQAFFEEKCSSQREKKTVGTKKNCTVPTPLQNFVGDNFCDIKWYRLFPGIVEKLLWVKGSIFHACLVKMEQGSSIPVHTHKGDAVVLVLCGSFSDGGTVYQKGAVIFFSANPDILHQPKAEEDCICLAVLHSPLHFKNPFRRISYLVRRFFIRLR